MGADGWQLAAFQYVVECFFTSVGEVDHHADAVHLTNYFIAEITQTIVFIIGTGCSVTDVVVTIVAESHVDHSLIAEIHYVVDVLSYGIAVLDAEEDGFPSHRLQPEGILWSESYLGSAYAFHHAANLL